ncbi:MAG TPA: SDR family NAD(P)-dependent oxidoreductase, partial [Thermoanaerobaculia bacterium]|nr:SDR family NAD(P)-dependent oxidoreductase [Thermoanaerobaculia bacterium]
MNVVLLGATRGTGRALARLLAARGDRLFLLGRHPEELTASARDLEVRAGTAAGAIGSAPCDLLDPASAAPALDAAFAALDRVDA